MPLYFVKLIQKDLTHFGHRGFFQTSREKTKSENKPFEFLNEKIIGDLYRHYWLDFVLLGYAIPPSVRDEGSIDTERTQIDQAIERKGIHCQLILSAKQRYEQRTDLCYVIDLFAL